MTRAHPKLFLHMRLMNTLSFGKMDRIRMISPENRGCGTLTVKAQMSAGFSFNRILDGYSSKEVVRTDDLR
jgi:hypothetical protein